MSVKINGKDYPTIFVDKTGKQHSYPSHGWNVLFSELMQKENSVAVKQVQKYNSSVIEPLDQLRGLENEMQRRSINEF